MVEQTKLTKQSFDEAEHDIKNYSQELLSAKVTMTSNSYPTHFVGPASLTNI